MVQTVKKRSGQTVKFNVSKIRTAISKANKDVKNTDSSAKILTKDDIERVIGLVLDSLAENLEVVTVEDVQDTIERTLANEGFFEVSKSYILYREKHRQQREASQKLMEQYQELLFADAKDSEIKRDNGNVNGQAPMGIMLQLGTEGAKVYADNYGIPEKFSKADKEGYIYIHDKDFSFITLNCLQQDLSKTFKNGFNTGHGHIREPNSIRSYAALAAVALQSSQNDLYGGQSLSGLDFTMAEGVRKSFKKAIREQIRQYLYFIDKGYGREDMDLIIERMDFDKIHYSDNTCKTWSEDLQNAISQIRYVLQAWDVSVEEATKIYLLAKNSVAEETHQAMEAFLFNMNTLHSRSGAQTVFSSVNLGMDTSPEGRLATREYLTAVWNGLGDGEIPVFPISIFVQKVGINYNPEDINYDLFQYAMKVSAKRLYPNFSNQDAPYNLKYYKPNDYRTFIATMGCRTRVIGNVNGDETYTSRGNFAFTTLNLPMIALASKGDVTVFWKLLDKYITICKDYLIWRFGIIAKKKVKNFPFVFGQGLYMGSEKLGPEDEIRSALMNASLSIGFCGLAECLMVLIGKHHGESEEAQELGLKIVGHIREKCDEYIKKTKFNFSCFATPAETAAGKLLRKAKAKFGTIPRVTDRPYFTNSSHIPVYYPISAFKKIQIEAPYHEMCSAGHIGYVEFDGDPLKNLPAFEKIIRAMHDANMTYYSINHAIDHCTQCGYTGIINNECPKCGAKEYEKKSVKINRCHCD